MSAYGRDIKEVMEWTYPQLRLMARKRSYRDHDDRRWQLMLQTGTLDPEMWDTLWQTLGGKKIGLESPERTTPAATSQPTKIGQQSHTVDAEGNIKAPGAPLLSDIAQGKAAAPPMLNIKFIDKSKPEE